MEFSLLQSEFIGALSKIVSLASGYNGAKPILRYILMDLDEKRLRMVSANDESEMEVCVPSACIDIVSGGKVAVPATSIFDICKFDTAKIRSGGEDRIFFKLDETLDRLAIRRSKGSYQVNCESAEHYPNITKVDTSVQFSISQGEMDDIISSTHFSMAINDSRQFLNGMTLRLDGKHLDCVTSDSHRLSLYTLALVDKDDEEEGHAGVIVSRSGIMALKKLISGNTDSREKSMQVSIGQSYVKFETAEFTFITKLIDGNSIDPKKFFPKESSMLGKVKIDRELLLSSVRSVAVIGGSKDLPRMIVEIKNDSMLLSTTNASHESAEISLPVEEFSGNESRIALNYNYLIEVLNSISGKDVNLSFSKTSSVFEASEMSDYCCQRYIIMLIQL